MSNAARNKIAIQPEVLRNIGKHDKLPTHDLHVGQHVMFQDSTSKQWHWAIITSLCQEKCSYKIKTSDDVVYQKMQNTPQALHTPKQATSVTTTPQATNETTDATTMPQPHHKQPMKQLMAQPNHNKMLPENNLSQVTTSRPKRDTKVPVKLDL